MLRCVDSVTLDGVIWGRDATRASLVLGYLDGAYPTYEGLVVKYRGTSTLVASVTTGLDPRALVIDCEAGDSTPTQAGEWAIAKIRSGHRPTVYGGAGALDLVARYLERHRLDAGLASYWLARYRQVSPAVKAIEWPLALPPGRQGWQFADSIATPGGHSFDVSIVATSWLRSVGLVAPRRFLSTRGIELRW